MSAKIIAVANMKGGVGKTTTVVSLAEALGASGHNVLVVDLDAQANASICLAGDSTLAKLMKQGLTIEGFLDDNLLGRRTMTFANCVRSNVSNVCHLNQQLPISLVPSSPELRHFEYRIIHELTLRKMSWTEIVQGLSAVVSVHLASARRKFDFILIDCAPGISVLTEVSIRLADLVIVPTIADFLSTFGLQAFCTTLSDRGLTNGVRKLPRKPHVLITRRRPVNIHGETAEILRDAAAAEKPPFRVFRTEIPEAVKVGEALGQIDRPGKKEEFPNFSQKWGPIVAPLLADLVQEIERYFMSIVIDGFAILQQLGKHADTFAVVRADVDKQARALVVKCLKKAAGLNGLREIHRALGDEQIGLVIEGLKDAEVKSLLTRLDKHHPDVKNGTVNWRSRHLRALADGSSDPAPPPVKAAKKSGGKKAKLGSATIDVFRAGANKKVLTTNEEQFAPRGDQP